ncbi:ribonuclease H-like domain-containing protein [Ralstonia solanacearum]|uniref:ribonuclease H-like domain-containing protein n=1 Tax=Ralstonia solanacearum TaxID=305 RepID=UPI000A4BA921|nr:ribonuclease H-like domain-containing protein [Ralstonia solanacearum]
MIAQKRQQRPAASRPRILFLDIETAPLLGYVWGLWNNNLGLNQVAKEWCILSYCAKWSGQRTYTYEDTFKQRNREDDKRLVRSLWKLLDQADIVVAQNGIKFDVRKIQARFILLGMPPPSPFRVVDTMIEARKHFGFTSNKLEWLTAKLCTKHKKKRHAKFPGFELWKEFLAGNPAAQKEMEEYNIEDTLSLEELYTVLRPWMQGHPNVGNYDDSEDEGAVKCPACGSHNVIRNGKRYTQVGQYARYQCRDCKHWSRGRLMTNTKAQRENLLVS